MRKVLVTLVFAAVAQNAAAIHLGDGGVVVTKMDMLAPLVGAAIGGGAYGYLNHERKNLFAVGAGAIGCVATLAVLSFLQASGRNDRERYENAEKLYDKLKRAIEKASHDDQYEKFETLIQKQRAVLAAILEKGDTGGIHDKCEALQEKYGALLADLLLKREQGSIMLMTERITHIVKGELVARVKVSYEETVAYSGSIVHEALWPLVEMVQLLRKTIADVSAIRDTCVIRREACIELGETDERYHELVEVYDGLSEYVKNEFPWKLFEQRVQQISSSEAFCEQSKLAAKERRHEAVLAALGEIKAQLEERVGEMTRSVASMKGDVEELIGDTKAVKNILEDVENKEKKAKELLENLQRNMRQISRDVITIRDNTRRRP